MTVTFTNLGATTLNGSITNVATSLAIPSGDVSKFPSSGNFDISVDTGANIELMTVTAGQGTATWTVTRGVSPTTAVAHNNAVSITEIVSAATLTSFVQTPMTAAGQMIAGGAGGAPVAVAAPTASTQVVSAVNGAPFLSAPSAPSLATATTGGTVAAGVYQCELSLVNTQGETVASASASITTTGTTSTITVTSPAAAGSGTQAATGWYAYVTQAGGSTYTRQQTAGSPTAIGTNLTISAPPTGGGANPPGSNTAGTLIPGWAVPAAGASGALTKINSTTLVSSAASVNFSSIPNTYAHLLIEYQARDTSASTGGDSLLIQCNGDTGSNYLYEEMNASTTSIVTTQGLAQTAAIIGRAAGGGNPANYVASGTCRIANYAGTSFYKTMVAECAMAANSTTDQTHRFANAGAWLSTAAITSLLLMPATGSFAAGCVFSLYGLS